jgi:hypothetical protein
MDLKERIDKYIHENLVLTKDETREGSVALISFKMNLVVFSELQAANEIKVLKGVFLASMI